jgi:hypothetical protein
MLLLSDKNNVISRRCEKEDFCLKKQSELMHVHYKPGRVTTKAKSLVSTYTVSENNVHHFIAGWMQPCLYVDTDLLYIWTMTQLLCETVTFSYTLHVGSTSSLYRSPRRRPRSAETTPVFQKNCIKYKNARYAPDFNLSPH